MSLKSHGTTSAFLNRLSEHILPHTYQVPFVRITRLQPTEHVASSCVKVEVDTDVSSRIESDSIGQTICECPIVYYDKCALCLEDTYSCHHYCENAGLALYENGQRIVQEVFQEVLSRRLEEIRFCRRCFHFVESLRACYVKFLKAQEEFQEALLRVRCFKKCATEVHARDDDFDNNSERDANDWDHFEESHDSEVGNVEVNQSEMLSGDRRKSHEELRRNCSVSYKGKSISRRGGLTEEEYKEHRRKQMAGYYLKKKRKLGKLENAQEPLNQESVSTSSNQSALDASETRSLDRLESLTGVHDKEALQTKIDRIDLSVKSEPETFFETSKQKDTIHIRKKYDYKGKTIRRRGGLTEEQYQAHRRAQSAQYYLERRKKIGKLTFGPKPLTVYERTKLEKAARVCVDSNSLPARSSCGFRIPVIEVEAEKRFSYRNVEFTKDDDGTLHCGNCGHIAKVLNVIKKHIAKIHFDKEYGYKCSHCDKTFYYQFQLRNHEGRHTEKGAGIQCEECGQSFKYSAGYYHHRRTIHQGVKPHECKPCNKRFGTRKDLRKHVQSKSHQALMSINENCVNQEGIPS